MLGTRKKPLHSIHPIIQRVAPFAVVGVIMFVGFFGTHWLVPSDDSHANHGTDSDELVDRPLMPIVQLTPEKQVAGKIHVSAAEMRELTLTKTLPGVVKYDESKHVEVRAPVECLVTKSLVQRGQWVQAGDDLAILTSPDVGIARNDVAKCESELKLARMEFEWAQQTNTNLTDLLALLGTEPSVVEVEARLEGKVLGDHRDALITAYSQYLLARNVVSRSTSLETSGALTGRVLEQRQSDREVAAARFKGVSEESRFQSEKDLVKARVQVETAERAWELSRDRLRTLLGPHGSASDSENRSEFALHAPLNGRVEEMETVESVRFQVGERMMVLADTHSIWVAAQVHQRDWNVLQLSAGQTLNVTVPALPDLQLSATVKFVGATVSPTTLAVPLVAEVANQDDTLRPGMFVWVEVPVSQPRRVLTVPASAVQRQEGRTFVFVEQGPRTYRRVDVDVAGETPSWAEITSGLSEGTSVVDEGGFYLTSELLLETEE